MPATKIKPDTASPWHGSELDGQLTLPLAFIRSQSAHAYKIVHGRCRRRRARLPQRLRAQRQDADGRGRPVLPHTDKRWLSAQDVGLAVAPATWPADAEKGKKWIEISITNQTLVLWEGKKPVYATLVSTGQAGLDDPKQTTATVRGIFHIRNKHVSAMMDSNESSSVGGRANTTASMASVAPAGEDQRSGRHGGEARRAPGRAREDAKGNKGGKSAKAPTDAHGKPIPHKGDGEYGVTQAARRGHVPAP